MGPVFKENFQSVDELSDSPIRVGIIIRRRFDCESLISLTARHDCFSVTLTSTNLEEGLLQCSSDPPDVIILDATWRASQTFRVVEQLIHAEQSKAILLLDDELNIARLKFAQQYQRVGYFTRETPFRDLLLGIIRLHQGRRAFEPDIHKRLQTATEEKKTYLYDMPHSLSHLTGRERQVMELIAQGNTVRKCASILSLAESTVDNHKTRLMKKLNVHKSSELTRLAIRTGMITA